MTGSIAKNVPVGQSHEDVAKVRKCLRCNTAFSSSWSGERICHRCKSSTAWRSGMPLGTSPPASRR